MATLSTIAEKVRKCTRCPLWKHRLQALPGEGKTNAQYIFIIESPDEIADRKGTLWDGKEGKQLSQILVSKKIPLDQVFLTSLVKCSSKGSPVDINEIEECNLYLTEQIASLDHAKKVFLISSRKNLPEIELVHQIKSISELKEKLN